MLALGCVGLLSVYGDRVELQNGHTLEGVVISTNGPAVRLDLGVGVLDIPRDSIVRVERSDPAGLRDQWADRYADHPAFLPESLRDLARDFQALEAVRKAALTAGERLATRTRGASRFDEEQARIQNEWDPIRRNLERMGAPGAEGFDSETYNRWVRQSNALSARLDALRRDRDREEESAAADRRTVSDYLPALDRMDRRLQDRSAAARDPETRFLKYAQERLVGWKREVRRMDLPIEWVRGQGIASVRINDRLPVRLVLDTGASCVTLTRKAANALGLSETAAATVPVRLADGSVVRGAPVWLDSVSVGEAMARNVEALILPDAPDSGVDGLLGMTFLREFLLRVDSAAGRVELISFRSDLPRPE